VPMFAKILHELRKQAAEANFHFLSYIQIERWREDLTDMQRLSARNSSTVGLMRRKQRYTAFRRARGILPKNIRLKSSSSIRIIRAPASASLF